MLCSIITVDVFYERLSLVPFANRNKITRNTIQICFDFDCFGKGCFLALFSLLVFSFVWLVFFYFLDSIV